MSITVNVADIPLLREPIDRAFAEGEAKGEARGEARGRAEGEAKGRAKGRAEGLMLMLETKFGALPDDLPARLMRLRPDDIGLMMRHGLAADSLEAALRHLPASRRRKQD